jgi:hypothetical protein
MSIQEVYDSYNQGEGVGYAKLALGVELYAPLILSQCKFSINMLNMKILRI